MGFKKYKTGRSLQESKKKLRIKTNNRCNFFNLYHTTIVFFS